jgi:hypothetical protein
VAHVAAAGLRGGVPLAGHAHYLLSRGYPGLAQELDRWGLRAPTGARDRLGHANNRSWHVERHNPAAGYRGRELDSDDRRLDVTSGGDRKGSPRTHPTDTRGLDEFGVHGRKWYVEHRVGVPVHAGTRLRAVVPGLRHTHRWEGGDHACSQRKWSLGPVGDVADDFWEPGTPGDDNCELCLDREGHGGAVRARSVSRLASDRWEAPDPERVQPAVVPIGRRVPRSSRSHGSWNGAQDVLPWPRSPSSRSVARRWEPEEGEPGFATAAPGMAPRGEAQPRRGEADSHTHWEPAGRWRPRRGPMSLAPSLVVGEVVERSGAEVADKRRRSIGPRESPLGTLLRDPVAHPVGASTR